jgi:putative transposase
MRLSKIGEIVKDEWLKIPGIRSDMNITIGDYVIMPDHIHAIITVGENQFNVGKNISCGIIRRDAMHCVSTKIFDKPLSEKVNTIKPQSKNLVSIIRGVKSATTTRARGIEPGFTWQIPFYDPV